MKNRFRTFTANLRDRLNVILGKLKKRKKRGVSGGLQRRWTKNFVSIVAAMVVLAVAAFAVVNALYYRTTVRSGMVAKAETATAFLGNYYGMTYNEYYQACATLAETYEDKNSIELQFISANGTLITSSYGWFGVETVDSPDLTVALSDRTTSVFTGRDSNTRERITSVSVPMVYADGRLAGVLRFITSMTLVDRQVLLYIGITVLIGLAVLVIVILSSRYFIRTILEPVSEITETSKRIAGGSYGVQIQRKFDDEIGELADTINDMSNKISQTEKMQSEFMSSVSHELRTPLTAISGWAETLLSAEEADPGDTKRGLEIILRETKRLTSMVEDLLAFTRMQDGRFTLNVQTCDILSEFEDTVFMYGNRLQQEGIALEYVEPETAIPEIPCDPARLRQVFLNILDNAAKHGGEGKKITASMTREGRQVVVRIRDFGPGIPEDELPHVKMKFYKGSSKARGSGIGLAVCEEIVTMHNGTLTLENAAGGGTLVTVRLPIPEEG